MANYMYSEIQEQALAVQRAWDGNKESIREIVAQLRKRPMDTGYIVARGTSDHIGIYAKYLGEYFLGIPFCLAASSIVNIYQRNLKLSSALTLAISQSGEGRM
jgi:glucosamine--fructose-6-phosphate aminotransferase (isomerizing)